METQNNIKPQSKNIIIIVLILIVVGAGLFFVFKSKNEKSVGTSSIDENIVTTSPDTDVSKKISLQEIEKHNSKESCWTTINGGVYDVTSFISKHKGGDKILAACGIDATDLFTGKSTLGRVHSQIAVKLLSGMKIGELQK